MLSESLIWRAWSDWVLPSLLVCCALTQFGCADDLELRQQTDTKWNEQAFKFPRATNMADEPPTVKSPWFIFEFIADAGPSNSSIQKIDISTYPGSTGLQTIDTTDSELLDGSGEAVEILDVNFDGYNDFRYPLFRTAGPNTPYRYWLYDINLDRFVNNLKLDELGFVILDADTKLLKSNWRSGQTYGENTYRFIDHELVQINEIVVSFDQTGNCQRSQQRLPNGPMQIGECTNKDL